MTHEQKQAIVTNMAQMRLQSLKNKFSDLAVFMDINTSESISEDLFVIETRAQIVKILINQAGQEL